ncbi:hypothetical protein PIB30_061482 [Stylosanthes scabra]|uniref:Uncharacterized protein n=1 Tax=Stylosanthes scabra TaxID=79078 RepID=A0ABU6ZJI5_9FABA|nr:hypothetical protein [Stylosanthes scabra]
MAILPIAVPRTKFVGKRPTSSRTRSGRAAVAEREPSPLNEISFDSREHYERSKLIFNRKILHERNTVYLQGRQIPIAENDIHYFLGINEDSVSKEEDAYCEYHILSDQQ